MALVGNQLDTKIIIQYNVDTLNVRLILNTFYSQILAEFISEAGLTGSAIMKQVSRRHGLHLLTVRLQNQPNGIEISFHRPWYTVHKLRMDIFRRSIIWGPRLKDFSSGFFFLIVAQAVIETKKPTALDWSNSESA